jgi:hypothetical protein
MGSIIQLCNRAIMLRNGGLVHDGKPEQIIQHYLAEAGSTGQAGAYYTIDATGLTHYIQSAELLDVDNSVREIFTTDEKIRLRIVMKFTHHNPAVELGLNLYSQRDFRVFTIHERLFDGLIKPDQTEAELTFDFPDNMLAPGAYWWVATMHIPHQQAFHLLKNICKFTVTDAGTKLASYEGTDIGVVLPKYEILK